VTFEGSLPQKFEADKSYGFKFSYLNTGAENANKVKVFGRVYAGPKQAQPEIVREFEMEWHNKDPEPNGSVGAGQLNTYPLPGAFEGTVVRGLNESTLMRMYFLFRIDYSDKTTTRRTDACRWVKVEKPLDLTRAQTCEVLSTRLQSPLRLKVSNLNFSKCPEVARLGANAVRVRTSL
jgi:hypothetical protein